MKLVACTNVNDIFHRILSCGDFSVTEVIPTIAPAMDIQVTNFILCKTHVLSAGNSIGHEATKCQG